MSDWKARARPVEPQSDWKARATPVEPPGREPSVGAGEAALQGFGQGASYGFSDELAGVVGGGAANLSKILLGALKTPPGRMALRAAWGLPDAMSDAEVDALADAAGDEAGYQVFGTKKLADADYTQARDVARRDEAKARTERPGAYFGGMVAGSVAAPGPKASKALTKLGNRVVQGAVTGAATGAGAAEELGDVPGGVARGGATGAVVAPLVGGAFDKAGKWLSNSALGNALKAIGLRAGISNELQKRGYETVEEGLDLGKQALEAGVIRPFRAAADVARQVSQQKPIYGELIEGAVAAGDEAVAREAAEAAAAGSGKPVFGFDATAAAAKAEGNLGALSPTAAREATRAQKLVEDVRALPEFGQATFKGANKLKQDMYEGISYAVDPALKTKLERQAARGLKESIEEQLAARAGPEVADQLRMANQRYGALTDIGEMASDEATRQAGRKSLTAMDLAAAAGFGLAGQQAAGAGGASAALLPIAARYLGPRVPSTLAVGQRALGRVLPKLADPAAGVAARAATKASELSDEEKQAIDAFLQGP